MLTHPILAEADAADRRVLDEHDGRRMFRRTYDRVAREQAIEDRKTRDENGVEYAVGQTVVTLCELWHQKPNNGGLAMMVPGYTGTLEGLDQHKAAIRFEGRTDLHFIRRDRMRLSVRVVK